jgi:WD40 repeat protein
MKREVFFLLLIASIYSSLIAQVDSYILKRQIFKAPLTSINISPDGKQVMGGFNDGSFRILDSETFETRLEVKQAHHKAVNAMDISPKMDFILSAGHNTIKLWDLSGKRIAVWGGHATTIWNAEFSKDGSYAVSSAFNKTFILWDVYNSVVLEQMRGHEDVTMAVGFSPDSRFIASGSNDQTVKIWDMDTRQVILSLHGPAQDVYDVEFSPDGQLLALASKDHSVRIYDISQEELIFLLKGHRDMVMEVEFSPDGNYLISASADQSVILWDTNTGEKIHKFIDNDEAVMDLAYHPDGETFYSISYSGDLTRWTVDPEIFVLRFFDQAYKNELSSDPIFEDKRKGESKKEFEDRKAESAIKKKEIIDLYYKKYLVQREH